VGTSHESSNFLDEAEYPVGVTLVYQGRKSRREMRGLGGLDAEESRQDNRFGICSADCFP
jgi:hypothetical protein